VRRERGFDIETFHKLQAAQVIAERIGNAVPRADVRAYVKKNVVAEENELALFVKKAKMPRSVSGRCKAAQLVAAVAQHVAVVKLARRKCAGCEFYRRGLCRPQGKILFRHALAQKARVSFLVLVLFGHRDNAVIRPAHQNAEALSGKISGVAGVVGVKMSDKNVGVVRGEAELVHDVKQRLAALRAIKPGVDKQIPAVGYYNIAVKPFERIVRQNDRKGVYIIRDFFNVHGG